MDWGNTVPDKHGALIPRDSEQEGFSRDEKRHWPGGGEFPYKLAGLIF